MSTIIIITPPGLARAEVSEAEGGAFKVSQGDATLFTCASKEEAICWLEHLKNHPHTDCPTE